MGRRHGNQPTVTQSSIALLQERFRQLQRVKEMREEREQQQCRRPVWFIHPDLIRPSRPLRGPPPGWFDDHSDRSGSQSTSPSVSSWLDQTAARFPVSSSEPDVDTTLHL
ncbi:unnamed protein product [Musa acuminata subsp. malaccensis]|uniref:(wild Malaysian banana) hypothetical protein n=1 Tax=Musa acuminata subsp. malaccensis TaxID=214687 RepID=A0A804IIB6_MUSAM|nr:unnamed protein product [Musa acuminata subsp. malaccensis]